MSVEIRDLHKQFGDTPALSGVTLTIDRGELFGFVGPDGAGKTTLFRILVTLLTPDRGAALVDGLDVVHDYRILRARLGYMPGRFSLYPDLSVEENLAFFAAVFGTSVRANYEWIRPVYAQLEPFRRRRAGALSGGMKQKLALSCALVHRPSVLVLDEPTTGVDAVSRVEFWENLDVIRESGVTILVSTPYMDEAGRCDRIALMQNGSILEVDRPSSVARAFGRTLIAVRGDAVRAGRRRALLEVLRAYPAAHSVYPFGDTVHLALRHAAWSGEPTTPEHVKQYLDARGFGGADAWEIEAGVEDVFMERMQAAGGAGSGGGPT